MLYLIPCTFFSWLQCLCSHGMGYGQWPAKTSGSISFGWEKLRYGVARTSLRRDITLFIPQLLN
jgi:hypothetical protein